MKNLKKVIKIKKIKKPLMTIWLLVPLISLLVATHYFFAKPNSQVLGISTENQIPITSAQSGINLYQKFNTFKWSGGGVISIVFTGAQKTQYDISYPEVAKRNLTASVTVPVDDIGLAQTMDWLNIDLLQYKGWEVISQSRNQICDLEQLKDQSVLDDEIQGSREDLTKAGLVVNTYISPCGIDSPQIEEVVKTNYQAFLKFGITTNYLSSINKYNLVARQVNNNVSFDDIQSWIQETKANNSWLILAFPNIGEDHSNNSVSHDLLDKTLDEVVKSNVQVIVPGEILKYDQK